MSKIEQAVLIFSNLMQLKLEKKEKEGKKGWETLPVEALYKFLKIEMSEFEVAFEHLGKEEARKELVDVANFCLILWDRLGDEK